MIWEQEVKEKFELLLSKLPFFHRHIAEKVVLKKAEELAAGRGSDKVQKQDLVEAFLSEIPDVFRSYLDGLLKGVGLD